MHRKEFLRTCTGGCLLALGLGFVGRVAAAVPQNIQKERDSTSNILPVLKDRFMKVKKEKVSYRPYLMITDVPYEWPIALYRFSDTEYCAILMRCSHQGTELSAHGELLSCPAHGSEFDTRGQVLNGPAEAALQTFEVTSDETNVYIHLL